MTGGKVLSGVLVAATLMVFGAAVRAQEKSSLPDVKSLAGTWTGEASFGAFTDRRTLVLKEDGSYESHGTKDAMAMGTVTLVDGQLRYTSTYISGHIDFSEDGKYQYLRFIREGGTGLGKFEYQREKPKK